MLKLTKNHYAQIIAHGKTGKPLEICGLLVGRKSGENTEVLEVHEVDSLDKSEKTYTLDSLQYLKIDRAARQSGLEIVGIYHTHPATQPYPSPTDMERAHWPETDDLLFPGFSYLIVSLRDVENPEPRSFKIVGKRRPDDIREETVQISN
ncbi:Proteasome lid subunit RPN8/RPN11, contains Jab1/MPN metalloenzyme (JAMM) motif [Abditibacterium utsteinense]|uniref:Proteasome lid subunit RPN8/RPN11, contains Jab1/MPN metalloenzyme (JAMM) motif n=1 Tax=Abditibacterium utsteinense TaxID=1960156 RepID=A0A2S8SV28_9BACT|nr:M67 family metallopeptidase [Abditibacterium utsteinense]PQV64636.1 Proteasome lid subunit RPN8/RPN11, contains Jab1/MPN metalloenzyme (JAMM) motif [Abditibacterium utsteinense]